MIALDAATGRERWTYDPHLSGLAFAEGASRGESQVLRFGSVELNEGTLAARGAEAVHLVGFFGDVTNNGEYSGLDASLIARATVGKGLCTQFLKHKASSCAAPGEGFRRRAMNRRLRPALRRE